MWTYTEIKNHYIVNLPVYIKIVCKVCKGATIYKKIQGNIKNYNYFVFKLYF